MRIVREPLGHLEGVLAVAGHTQGQGLHAKVQQEGVERRGLGAHVAHQLGAGLDDVGQLAEGLGVDEAVVGGVGLREVREAAGGGPIEVAAVDDDAAQAHRVAVEVFRARVHHHVRAPFEGTAEVGRGEGVVQDEGEAVPVRDPGPAFHVKDGEGGVRQRLAEDSLGVRADGRLDFLVGGIRVDPRELDAQLLERHAEEVDRAAVDLRARDDVVARMRHGEERDHARGLAGAGQHRAHAALERGDALLHVVERRVAQARVKMPAHLQVEQIGHMLRGIELKGRALIDRGDARLAVLRVPPRLNAFRLKLHPVGSFLLPASRATVASERLCAIITQSRPSPPCKGRIFRLCLRHSPTPSPTFFCRAPPGTRPRHDAAPALGGNSGRAEREGKVVVH